MRQPLLASRLIALLVVAVAAFALGTYRFGHDRPRWTPDGAIYLRMMLADRGAPPDAARRAANAFVAQTPEGRNPSSRGFYRDAPPAYYESQFALFSNRPLYPALGATLYPAYGPDALKALSALAFVGATVAAYLLLLQLAAAWLAAVGALGLATAPAVLALAGMPLTDELGLALWVAALGALLAYVRTRAPAWLIALLAATAALTFTRPAFYLPLGAALGAYALAPRGSPARAAAGRAALGIAAVGAAFFAYSAVVHGPSVVAQLRWQYDWQHATHGPFAEHGFGAWWSLALASALGRELVLDLYKSNVLFTVALAALGAVIARGTALLGIVAGGALATLCALLVNPVEIERTVTLPLTPLLVVLATVALAELAKRVRERPC